MKSHSLILLIILLLLSIVVVAYFSIIEEYKEKQLLVIQEKYCLDDLKLRYHENDHAFIAVRQSIVRALRTNARAHVTYEILEVIKGSHIKPRNLLLLPYFIEGDNVPNKLSFWQAVERNSRGIVIIFCNSEDIECVNELDGKRIYELGGDSFSTYRMDSDWKTIEDTLLSEK